MSRTMLACALLALAAPAHADLTIRSTSSGKGFGISGDTTAVTYIKGLKMRTDTQAGRKSVSQIFDVDAQKMYMLDHKDKEVQVWDMAAFAAQLSSTIPTDSMQASIKPNGQTKALGGHTAEGHDVEVVVPASAGGMPIPIRLSGTTWIAKGAPGSADYAAFYQGAAEKGWIFGDPRAAQGSPGQAKALAQMYLEFARIGGLPLETVVNIKMDGGGAMGGLMSKIGGMQMTTTMDSVETGPVDDGQFQPPADYKVKPQ